MSYSALQTFCAYSLQPSNVVLVYEELTEEVIDTIIKCALIVQHTGKVVVISADTSALMDACAKHFLSNVVVQDKHESDNVTLQIGGSATRATYVWSRHTVPLYVPTEVLPGCVIQSAKAIAPIKQGIKLGLSEPAFGHRGTLRSMRDYARFARQVLKVDTVLFIQHSEFDADKKMRIEADAGKLIAYTGSLNDALRSNPVDVLVMQRAGWVEERPTVMPCVIHCVFTNLITWGEKHTRISECVPSTKNSPVVHYTVVMPDGDGSAFRARHNIPQDALVVGRHGGYETFDVPFVWQSIAAALEQRPSLYFVFMNTDTPPQFKTHPRVVTVPITADLQDISDFVNGCDAMLHARVYGETFGLACAEFAYFGKPVLSYSIAPADANYHYELLKHDALVLYANQGELTSKLLDLHRGMVCAKTRAFVRTHYHPWSVMPAFARCTF